VSESNQASQFNDRETSTLTRAVALWHQGRQIDSLKLFDQAIDEDPTNIRALLFAARSFGGRFYIDKADALLERVLELVPSNSKICLNVGKVYEDIELPEKATAFYERAIDLPDCMPISWIQLASQYERLHRLDQASELIDRALSAEPDHPKAMLVRAKLERRGERADLAQATLRRIVETQPNDSEWYCEAWAGIGEILDSQGDYDGAMSAIRNCKLSQMESSYDVWKKARQTADRYRQLHSEIQNVDLDNWRAQAEGLAGQRVAVLAGFPRSGTTILEQVLDSHPDLVSAEEFGVFSREIMVAVRGAMPAGTPILEVLNNLSPGGVGEQRSHYLQVMERMLREPVGERMLLDKNPAITRMIPLIARIFPEMRYLVALRDPRDVILSCYLRYLPANPVSVSFLSLERVAARYASDMSAWLKTRDMLGATWCEVRYEDIVSDLELQARRALETLGLPWDDRVLSYRERLATKRVTSPTYEAVTKPIYASSIGRWKNYQQYLEPVLDQLDPFIEQFGYSR